MRKTNKRIQKEVNIDLLYKPLDIVNSEWIYNGNGKYTKNFILRLIRLKRLKAKDAGIGKVPHYRVRGIDILEYIDNCQ